MLELVALIVVALAFAIILLRMNISVILFISYNLITALVGLSLLASDGTAQWSTVAIYASCVVAFLGGFVLGRRRLAPAADPVVSPKDFNQSMSSPLMLSSAAVYVVVFVAGGFAMYHLVVGGIPLFSSGSVEVQRFDFTSSGLFGIPGRMYLFGVPVAWIIATTVATSRSIKLWRFGPWIWATLFYVSCGTLSGFKSGLSAMLFVMAFSLIVITGTQISLGKLLVRHGWLMVVAGGYALYTLSTYQTYQSASVPLWRSILDRSTIVGAQPKQYAIEGFVSGNITNGIANDFVYFLAKYTGNQIPGSYSLERAVSAQIIGVDPSSDAWTTPVTVGGFPELVYSLGVPLAIVAALLVGLWVAALHRQTPNSQLKTIWRAVAVYFLYSWILKGGLAYYSLNIGLVASVLVVLAIIVTIIRPPAEHYGRRRAASRTVASVPQRAYAE